MLLCTEVIHIISTTCKTICALGGNENIEITHLLLYSTVLISTPSLKVDYYVKNCTKEYNNGIA